MSKKRSPKIPFILLTVYIFAQFVWWMNLIIGYNPEKKWMVAGEGSVFLLLMILGIYTIYKSVLHEIRLAKTQQNFLLAITHELKTPLAAVKLYLQTLTRRQFEREKQEEILYKALNENDRLQVLIEKLLLAARLDVSEFPLHKERISLSPLLEQTAQRLRDAFGEGRAWHIDIEPNLEAWVDSTTIESITENLIENAIKYSHPTGAIAVRGYQQGKKIHLSVSDSGPGIQKEDVARVFDKFYRSGDEHTRKNKGTGLGLYIVKQLVELNGGRIWIDQNSDQGCTFVAEFNSPAQHESI
ncbi:MAG TPA: HAMP domain-containing sensor histidine kinase [Luteibaculaceae bacterium]|nr:HAMP domain-containing sensor histidine kinase [Luteibaculaceae bacterium]